MSSWHFKVKYPKWHLWISIQHSYQTIPPTAVLPISINDTLFHPAKRELTQTLHTHMHIKTWRHTWLLSHLHPIQHQILTALLWKIFSVSPLFIASIINILVQDTIINQLDYWHNFHVLSLLPPYNIQSVSQIFNRSYHLSVQNPLASNITQAKNSFFGPWVYLVYWL